MRVTPTSTLGLDVGRGKVDQLHPGLIAMQGRTKELAGSGWSEIEICRAGNKAYCQAMRGWQDDFHLGVFRRAGLLRIGPRRLRLDRPEYEGAKKAAADRGRDLRAWEVEGNEMIGKRRELIEHNKTSIGLANDYVAIAREEFEALAERREINAEESRRNAKDRETKSEASRRNAEERESIQRRGAEVEARIVTIEAMAEGGIVLTETGKFQPTGSFGDATYEAFLSAVRRAPDVAVAVARRLSATLAAARPKARDEGIAEARRQAAEEVSAKLTALDQAAFSIAAVSNFAKALIRRIGGASEQAALNAELDALGERGMLKAAHVQAGQARDKHKGGQV